MYTAFRKDWEPEHPLKKSDWDSFEKTGTLGLTQVQDYEKPTCWIYLAEEFLTIGVLAHEILHAVIASFRHKDKNDILHLGKSVSKKEEDFCHEYDYAFEVTYRKFFNSSIWGSK